MVEILGKGLIMQTFLPDIEMQVAVSLLDNKRLGKQRVEAIQIAMCLLEKPSNWKNHPAVLMWKGYEPYLLEYIKCTMDEFAKRGYKNIKCVEHYNRLKSMIKDRPIQRPIWYNSDFVKAHQSNLVRKNKDYYSRYFNVPDNLPYIWKKEK